MLRYVSLAHHQQKNVERFMENGWAGFKLDALNYLYLFYPTYYKEV